MPLEVVGGLLVGGLVVGGGLAEGFGDLPEVGLEQLGDVLLLLLTLGEDRRDPLAQQTVCLVVLSDVVNGAQELV